MIEVRERRDRQGRKWKSYRVGIRDYAGKLRWETLPKGATRADAEAADATLKLAKRGGYLEQLLRSDTLMHELFSWYWENWALKGGLELNSQASYASCWNKHLNPRIGMKPTSAMTSPAVYQLRVDLVNDGVTPVMVRKCLAVLQSMFREAVAAGKVPVNPVVGVKKPRYERKREIRVMAVPVVEALAGWFESRGRLSDAIYIRLQAYAGPRPAEIRALNKLNYTGEKIWIGAAQDRDNSMKSTKTKKGRALNLFGDLAERLDHYIGAMGIEDMDPLFQRVSGGRMTRGSYDVWRKNWFKKAVKELGLPVDTVPYDLRHTCASLMIAAGFPVTDVAAQLGHSQVETMRTYAHLIATQGQVAARQRIDAEISAYTQEIPTERRAVS